MLKYILKSIAFKNKLPMVLTICNDIILAKLSYEGASFSTTIKMHPEKVGFQYATAIYDI